MLGFQKSINEISMVNIKNLRESEYYKILKIENHLFDNKMSYKELKSFTNQVSFKIWKIEMDQIIGYVSFFHIKDEVEIIKIGINKSHQRQNYGSLLIEEIKKLKIKKIFLEVSIENVNAINFYLKNGFQKIGVRKGYYANDKSSRIDALRFCAKL
tara:strand:- start:70 stop:537 length:468 start_codon:yes stop_codon:yes gene_type:complete